MGKYQGYEKYKDSGVEWFGEIPEHWLCMTLRRFSKLNQGLQIPQSERFHEPEFDRVEYITIKSIHAGETNQIKEYIHNPTNRVICKKEDILVARTGATGEVITGVEGAFHNNFFKVSFDDSKIHKDYYVYFLKNTLVKEYLLLRAGTTTIPDLNHNDFLSVSIGLPPLDEQETIAQFLDHKTKQIDELIAKKEALLEKLDEKRTALISHAVTKGLDPNVPMKDSGIEWLGEIPEHWSINRLGRLTEEINDINHEMPVAVDQGIPFLSAKDLLDDGTLNFEKDIKKISEDDFIRLSKKIRPKRNDIIYSRIGACLGKARIVEVDIEFLVSYSCCVIRLRQELANPRFFKYFLDSELVLSEARFRTQGIGVPDLGLKQISKFTISVPSIGEQIEIAEYLDKKTTQINQQKSKIQQAIELLKEYRTALITNAVTGKINVRQVPIP